MQSSEAQTGRAISWFHVAVCSLLFYVFCVWIGFAKLDLKLGDSDDALRLVQLKAYLAHGDWYNLRIDRLAPPDGYLSHWSRIPDAIMAVIAKLASVFVGPDRALFWTRALYPGLWIAPAFMPVAVATHALVRNRFAVAVAFLVVATNPISVHQFMAGRIDHHGAQIALSVLALVCLALSERKSWLAGLAGGLTAVCLAIGLEALLLLVVPAAVLAFRFVVTGQGRQQLLTYASCLAVVMPLMLYLALRPGQLLTSVCDALAFNLAAAVTAGAVAVIIACLVLRGESTHLSRLIAIAVAGVIAATVYAGIEPTCLKGPFAAVDPVVKERWLNTVNEMQPVLPLSNSGILAAQAQYFAFMIPVLPAMLWLLRMPRYRNSFMFLTLCAGALAGLVFGLLTLRTASYTIWFVAPILCAAMFELAARLKPRFGYLGVAVPALFAPITMVLVAVTLLSPLAVKASDAEAKAKCLESQFYVAMARLPAGLVMSETNLGTFVLALTPHEVVAAPYHRIGPQILEAQNFFASADLTAAQARAKALGLSYVAICRTGTIPKALGENPGLYKALLDGRLPIWLAPAAIESGNPVEVYAVRP